MQAENETHQEPKAHNTKRKAIFLIILACLSAIVAVPLIVAYLIPYIVACSTPPNLALVFNEQLVYSSYVWGKNDANITLNVQNIGPSNAGPSTLSIANVEVNGNTALNVKINGVTFTYGTTAPVQLTKGSTATIVITQTFTSGIEYNFIVITAKGNQFGPYTLTAPSF